MGNKEKILQDLKIGCGVARPVKAPRGSELHCKGWYQEAALRMLCNNLDPDNGEEYQANGLEYKAKLETLDSQIDVTLENRTKDELLIYHPSWGYYTDDHGLVQIPVEEEGKEPTLKGLNYTIEHALSLNLSYIYVSPQFNPEFAEYISGYIDGDVLSVDPLAGNYIENIELVTAKFAQGLD